MSLALSGVICYRSESTLNGSRVAALANGGLIFAISLVSIPAIALRRVRVWLRVQAWGVALCAVFTLALGLDIWFITLRTRANLNTMWGEQTPETQSLLQRKVCHSDLERMGKARMLTLRSSIVAAISMLPAHHSRWTPRVPLLSRPPKSWVVSVASATLQTASSTLSSPPYSVSSVSRLDPTQAISILTSPAIALDIIVLLCIGMVVKRRAERDRYRHIDEKRGFRRI